MKQLYTSYPHGAAGFGLLLLRVVSAAGFAEQSRRLLCAFPAGVKGESGAFQEWAVATILIASVLLLAGLLTSWAATAACLAALGLSGFGPVDPDSYLLAALCIVIALLGPGALSFDARLFGWQSIRFPHPKGTASGGR